MAKHLKSMLVMLAIDLEHTLVDMDMDLECMLMLNIDWEHTVVNMDRDLECMLMILNLDL